MLIGGRDFAAWGGPSPALRMAPGAVLCCHPHILLPGQSNFSVAGARTKILDWAGLRGGRSLAAPGRRHQHVSRWTLPHFDMQLGGVRALP